MTSATSTTAVTPVVHIPFHKLGGPGRSWANLLLSMFRGMAVDGVEWSMKFSAAGLTANRFLLGVSAQNWHKLDLERIRTCLCVPSDLWLRIVDDMSHSQAMFFAYEPDEGAGTYRIYLEYVAMPDVLKREGVRPLGCGYKWNPETGQESAITVYRQRYLPDRHAFQSYLEPYFCDVQHDGIREVAATVLDAATDSADPTGFMFLEVDETQSSRRSFTVTFRGADIPVRHHIPDFLRLASALALPESQILEHFVPDEPRSICSLGVGTGRDGHEFLTVYYD